MKQLTQPIFISFEGIDGAGKSTHIQSLADQFKSQGLNVTLTREPGGTELAEKIRQMVLNDPMDSLTESLLVFAARRDHLQKVILPALGQGNVVICDRFTDATFAYQGGGRGFDLSILKQLETWVQTSGDAFIEPDLTLWFELNPEIAAQRLVSARVPDRFESQPVQFFNAVHNAYKQRAHSAPSRFACINADQSKEFVWKDILVAVQKRGWI
jgi:dTMP kinase